MTHPAIDPDDAARLRAEVAGPAEAAGPASGPTPAPEPAPAASARWRDAARKAAAPVVARIRQELVAASAHDQADLRAQVAEMRSELARTRAEHAAELAALHEELAARTPPS